MWTFNNDTDGEEGKDKVAAFVDQKTFASRHVLVYGPITQALAKDVCGRLLALAAESRDPINMIVCSPGGHVESGDAIHDMVRFIEVPVNMIGSGWVASAGTHIFLAAPKERRVCLPNTRFLIHQPSGGAGGQATDIAIQAREIIKMRERLARIIAAETGQPLEKVQADIDRDYWMSTDEAIAYGLVSKVVERRSEI
ncbi:MAG TPA: ATP-dependent Clp protease proteolytic subunit [Burkholderiaceae bacterium]|nr:ATP-dependent Clp protease proteolytic subunit [Burkholderiaceae bacterium]